MNVDAGLTYRTEPFFMMPKKAVSLIISNADGGHVASCIAVYSGLRWAANDERKADGPVGITVNEIARRAGVSYNTAEKAIGILKALGIVTVVAQKIPGTKLRGPSIYTFPNSWGSIPKQQGLAVAENNKEQKESKESCDAPASPPIAEANTSKNPRPRSRNQLLDALAVLDGSELEQITNTAWQRAAKALKEINEVCPGVTVAEINRRAAIYRQIYSNAATTALAFSSNWGACDKAPGARSSEPVRVGSNVRHLVSA